MLLLSGMEGCMCGWDGKKKEGWIGEAGREEDRVGMHADAEKAAGLKRVMEMEGRGTE